MASSHLFSPVEIGRVTVRNRIAMLPMGARLSPDGTVSAAEAAWSAERARGGIGVMISGGALVHPTSNARGNPSGLIEGWRDEGLEAQRRRVDAVHRHGAKIFGQFLHLGRDVNHGGIGGLLEEPVLAPSARRSGVSELVPHGMDDDDIRMIVEAFGHTAELFQQAGMDGLEIHGAHNYLVGQFLSRSSNHRQDSYGTATIASRMRFLDAIIAEIRHRCGDEITLGVRLSAVENVPDGITIDETKQFAERLESGGAVDYLSLTVGVRGAYVKDNSHGFGVSRSYAAEVRKATGLKLLVGGRITTPELAEEMIAEGTADLVGLGRALIADPEWAAKAERGEGHRIRPCVGFVQDCRLSQGGVTCAVNAGAGRELAWSVFAPPSAGRLARIMVVGGGPGGMEAARLAAQAGHDVTLAERSDQLGGQLLRAGRTPFRSELLGHVRYLEGELAASGVSIERGREVTGQQLAGADADLVVLATGARPDRSALPTPVPGGPDVLSTWDLLDGTERDLGRRVLLVDDGTGFWEVCGAADFLVERGVRLEFATPNAVIGRSIPHESLPPLHQRLMGAGVIYSVFSRLDRLDRLEPGGAVLRNAVTGETRSVAVDTVVVQLPALADDGVAAGLSGTRYVRIGDAVSPRRLSYATLDANRVIRGFTAAPSVAPNSYRQTERTGA